MTVFRRALFSPINLRMTSDLGSGNAEVEGSTLFLTTKEINWLSFHHGSMRGDDAGRLRARLPPSGGLLFLIGGYCRVNPPISV
jgi:hypothetical protein